jgi:hypothetical protein
VAAIPCQEQITMKLMKDMKTARTWRAACGGYAVCGRRATDKT